MGSGMMTDIDALKSRIEIRQVDITTLPVDAIVNAANERMLGGGGVDGAIHRAAGAMLVEECRAVLEVRPGVRCPTGEARLTRGYNLPAKYVIHTVGPVWHGGMRGEPDQLASCYRSSLLVAAENEIHTVAFPAISCGVYGYPLDKAAAVAVHEVATFLAANPGITRVVFAAFDASVEAALKKACRAEPLLS
jgi:O-acetyl-ADP-ribose deacetylase (regulator of RNase III)